MDAIPSLLTEFGLPGLVITGLGYTVKELFTRYIDSQEKRILEARETISAMNDNTRAIDILSTLIREGK